MSDTTERLPPHNDDAEAAVLGSVMLDRDVVRRVAGIVRAEDFYRDAFRLVFEAMIAIDERDEPVDFLTLTEELHRRETFEPAGGITTLTTLLGVVPTPMHAERYAAIVARCGAMRRLISAGGRIATIGFQNRYGEDEAVERASALVESVLPRRSRTAFSPISDVLSDFVDRLAVESEQGSAATVKIPTGFADLDRQLSGGMGRGDLVILAARPSVGKALRIDEPVLTPTGWTPIGSLNVGDRVVARDGRAYPVLGVYPQGEQPVWRVTTADGGSVVASDDHLWMTSSRSDRKAGREGFSVRTTREIRETLRAGGVESRLSHQLPIVSPVRFDEKALPLDPYLLGVLLGDGSLGGASIRIDNPERDVRDRVFDSIPESDAIVETGPLNMRIVRRRRNNERSETAKILSDLGLYGARSHEKFVPDLYLYGDVDQRRALLAGLLDTDGSVHANGCAVEYASSSKRLADAVVFLARSLGMVTTSDERTPWYTYDDERRVGKTSYRVMISTRGGAPPVTSSKHLARWRGSARPRGRTIRSVESEGVGACVCIAVGSPDNTFVTRDFIVTHNTALALNVTAQVALRYGGGVGIFSMEMSREQVAARLLAIESAMSTDMLGSRDMTNAQMIRFGGALGSLAQSRIYVDDASHLTVSRVRSMARGLVATDPVDLIVVDHLQLMAGEGRSGNRVQDVSEITRQLKGMARDLDVPVLVLSQLNRSVENRQDKRPNLSDLRESGAIEQDADVVLFLYRQDYHDRDAPHPGLTELNVAKHRNGPTGKVDMLFDRYTTRFYDLEMLDDEA